jgi:hypothetical protein
MMSIDIKTTLLVNIPSSQILQIERRTSKAQPLEKMLVVHLDQLAPYQGSAWDKQLCSGSCWGVITVEVEPWGRMMRLTTNITSTALGIEEMAVCLRRLQRGISTSCYAMTAK